MKDYLRFVGQCVCSAYSQTKEAFRLNLGHAARALLTVLIFFSAVYVFGGEAGVSAETLPWAAGAIAVAGTIIGTFLFNFFLAPWRMLRETERKLFAVRDKQSGLTKQEIAEWAKVPRLKLWQAACLWADQSPSTFENMGGQARAIFERLKLSARAGTLDYVMTKTGKEVFQLMNALDPNNIPPVSIEDKYDGVSVTRKHLIDYASKHEKERPRFLFGEDGNPIGGLNKQTDDERQPRESKAG